MSRIPTVAAIMTPFPHALDSSSTVAQARHMMQLHEIHHIPVQDDHGLVGLVSASDLRLVDDDNRALGEVCRYTPVIVDIHARLDSVVGGMAEDRCDAVIVVKQGRLAGILTTTDVCRALAERLRILVSSPGNEAA